MTPKQIYFKQLQKALANQAKGDDCMKGKIYYSPDRCRWRVYWYDEVAKKDRHIWKYKGEYMPCTAFKMNKGKPVLDKKNRLIPDKEKCQGYERAQKLLTMMRNRYEEAKAGLCEFRIEEFTKDEYHEVADFYKDWIENEVAKRRKPATIKAYRSYHKCWIKPFFNKANNVRLHEVDLGTLMSFLDYILNGLEKQVNAGANQKTQLVLQTHAEHPDLKSPALSKLIHNKHGIRIADSWIRRVIAKTRAAAENKARIAASSVVAKEKDTDKALHVVQGADAEEEKNYGKTALNIVSTLHTMMDYAYRKGKVRQMPSFPKDEDYGIQPVKIKWLTRDKAEAVFAKIPQEHLPIFLWLKYHFRRPGEACALLKIDYDPVNEVFSVSRALSARIDVNSVKTNWQNPTIQYTPCHPDFVEWAKDEFKKKPDSKYFFNNPRSRSKGRYTLEALRNIWYKACDDAGVDRIWTYKGVKHTACTQFMEDGGTEAELQLLTGHKNPASVKRYAEITAGRIKQAQEAAKRREQIEVAKEEKQKAENERLVSAPCRNLANVIPFRKKIE